MMSVSSFDRAAVLALAAASRAITGELDLKKVFQRIVEQACQVFDADAASVLLLDADGRSLTFEAAMGSNASQVVGTRFGSELGVAGQVLKTGRPVSIDDVQTNRKFFDGIDQLTGHRTQGLIAAPLTEKRRTLGVVEVVNPRQYGASDQRGLDLLMVFANLAAAAAINAQAYVAQVKYPVTSGGSGIAVPIVGQSAPIKRVIAMCRKAALSSAAVLIEGETGSGKELVARAVHDFSARRAKPFVVVNCAALPESLLESELFGHVKGAFTGAVVDKPGHFEQADGGTLFLDEIGEISPAVQAKLLRVVEHRAFVRVGGTGLTQCDVRIITATNRDLKREVIAGKFRDDLYYRLNVFPIELPPLRCHPEDVPLLVEHFLDQIARETSVARPTVTPAAMTCLSRYPWPGNVRQLRNILERCALMSEDGRITPQDLPPEMLSDQPPPVVDLGAGPGGSKLAEHERRLIHEALEAAGWNVSESARKLGITRDQLRYRMEKYGLRRSS